jgi:hypothetical protein
MMHRDMVRIFVISTSQRLLITGHCAAKASGAGPSQFSSNAQGMQILTKQSQQVSFFPTLEWNYWAPIVVNL